MVQRGGMDSMVEFIILIGVFIIGGGAALLGFLIIIGRKVTQPDHELQQKIDRLEREIKDMKNEP
ncbi:hypothetical protein HBHAL_4476 [Halobacillus halophilus DSM 2266]|uniref:DUF4083 domain-containing protein n=2 Tax=Halobacillus halophilus TaxID=1570 RepID=I0JRP5_HALH3|nr:hypothetical protein HBHAL_4476 [Halobacillus halophilus DSM 2266]